MESLFKIYSKLAFTNPTDRSIAISGLESRFASAFETKVSYGISQRYLHRSILWQRSMVKRTERIEYPPDRKVPSWSWMAYEGEISYMDIPFGKVEWSNAITWERSEPELQALVREFLDCKIEPQEQNAECDIFAKSAGKIGWLKFDREDITDTQRLKYIVVGRAIEERGTYGQVHYVLVVTLLKRGYYERVGVGSIQRRHISFKGRGFKARII